jgi:ferritin
MVHAQMQAAINDQINAEIYSAYLYLSMSAYYADLNLPGFANWMRVQAQEEMVHAMKFYDFMVERGGRIALTTIAGPETNWDDPAAPFIQAYAHEQMVTGRIHDLVTLAMELKDYASVTFLDWFVTEQVEEESNTDNACKQLKLIGSDRSALFMYDRELATRIFVPPVTPAAGA